MSNITFTEEQEAIIEEARRGAESLSIEALAGAAKTTTLVAAAHKLPMVPTISLAFNKKIADEMGRRMPGHITSSTMNSLGHRVWGQTVGKRLTVDSGKSYGLLKTETDKLKGEDAKTIGEAFASILRVTRRAKAAGYIPEQYARMGRPLVTLENLLDTLVSELDMEPDDLFVSLVDRVLEMSIAQAYQGLIDFDDQIYMPTLFGGNFPKFPLVLIDEAQDLSPLNHETLQAIFGGRIIAVGDPWQAIYGFRGASHNSMKELEVRFSMKTLHLSTSFRCPKAVVERARRRVPHMTYPDWAEEGEVLHWRTWDETSVPEGAFIICRNNAPLFRVALNMIRRGRNVKMKTDIGPSMIKLLLKMGERTTLREQVFKNIDGWREIEVGKARESRHAVINDRAECLKVFAEQGKTLGEAVAFAEHLFAASGTVELMTGHGAKGLEADFIIHLDPWRIPSKHAKTAAEAGDSSQMEQELNLRYVIETRAKRTLVLAQLDDFGGIE